MTFYSVEDEIRFGKCKGEKLKDIYKFNPEYIEWLVKHGRDFLINLSDFKKLPKPTPFIFLRKGSDNNIMWINHNGNFVQNALNFISTGGVINEKQFSFSEETEDIIKQKERDEYVPIKPILLDDYSNDSYA